MFCCKIFTVVLIFNTCSVISAWTWPYKYTALIKELCNDENKDNKTIHGAIMDCWDEFFSEKVLEWRYKCVNTTAIEEKKGKDSKDQNSGKKFFTYCASVNINLFSQNNAKIGNDCKEEDERAMQILITQIQMGCEDKSGMTFWLNSLCISKQIDSFDPDSNNGIGSYGTTKKSIYYIDSGRAVEVCYIKKAKELGLE